MVSGTTGGSSTSDDGLVAKSHALLYVQVCLCEGFRMPARDDGARDSGTGVRKPPREEIAGRDTLAVQRVLRGIEGSP